MTVPSSRGYKGVGTTRACEYPSEGPRRTYRRAWEASTSPGQKLPCALGMSAANIQRDFVRIRGLCFVPLFFNSGVPLASGMAFESASLPIAAVSDTPVVRGVVYKGPLFF